ncbi:MAG: ADP-ribosylglycohydrolase family protein, partial [Myxococcota bacterium]
GTTGFVSDDTEQTALIAQALIDGRLDIHECTRCFRRSMVGWFARLPFGIGFGTLRACIRMALGFRVSGVRSAGNGAAMRAGIIGAVVFKNTRQRRALGQALASVTHTDARAIQTALFVAEVSAGAVHSSASPSSLLETAKTALSSKELIDAVERALDMAASDASIADAARQLGNTGFAVHTNGLCTFCFARAKNPLEGVEMAIAAGGDTDTHAAIVGGWCGALYGRSAWPENLVRRLFDGIRPRSNNRSVPFAGPRHLRGLASALARGTPPPRWSWPAALLRNLALYPVVIGHGIIRILF